jgi:uncharacterized DUF497 family protein
MIDWSQLTGFDWDSSNARKIADKHDVSQAESEQVFLNQPLLVLPDVRHSHAETRYHALGTTDTGRRLHISFTIRLKASVRLIRVISARDMHRKERTIYEQAKKDP